LRVVYFRLRGILFPALALPDPSVPIDYPHDITIILSAKDHCAELIEGVVGFLLERGREDWELCLGAQMPLTPDHAQAIARHRGARPWIRIIDAEATVATGTSAQWTIEQATGEYVALLAPNPAPRLDVLAKLLPRLRDSAECAAVAMMSTENEAAVVLLRKSNYLAWFHGEWALTAREAFKRLGDRKCAIAYLPADRALAGAEPSSD
jgi:hypothetical protein